MLPPSAVIKLNTCPAVDLELAAANVGALPSFHMIDVGQVNAEPKLGDQLIVSSPAVGSPLALKVLGVTAAVVVELSDWQHKTLVLVILVKAPIGGMKFSVYTAECTIRTLETFPLKA